jgi:hypothetical protein
MPAATRYRTFTENERANRDAWITGRVENDCEGCVEFDNGMGWTPVERCPVHGRESDDWWRELNVELDRRWPGTWHDEEVEV